MLDVEPISLYSLKGSFLQEDIKVSFFSKG